MMLVNTSPPGGQDLPPPQARSAWTPLCDLLPKDSREAWQTPPGTNGQGHHARRCHIMSRAPDTTRCKGTFTFAVFFPKTSPGPQCKHEKTLREVESRDILQKYLSSPPQTVKAVRTNNERLRSHRKPEGLKEALYAAGRLRGILDQTERGGVEKPNEAGARPQGSSGVRPSVLASAP